LLLLLLLLLLQLLLLSCVMNASRCKEPCNARCMIQTVRP
jgi:hypothetical protein